MSDNKDKKRIAPPADALERFATAVKNAPNHPAVRTWADVIRQGWPDFRDLVLKRKYRATDVAGMLRDLFQREFDEDYLRRLLLAEATARHDKKMLKALGKPPGLKAKPTAEVHDAASPSGNAAGTIPGASKKSKKAPKATAPGGAGSQSEANLNGDAQPVASAGDNSAPQNQIQDRLRRMHGK